MNADYTISKFTLLSIDKKAHLQKWARTYFADHLRDLGFVSWRGEDLSWYKLVGGEVLLTVYLFDSFGYLPMIPCLAYGMHAPFIKPEMPQKVTMRESGWVSETMNFLYFDNPMRQMAPEIQVMATDTPDGGYRKFEETVLPLFDGIHTLEDAYRPFREYYIDRRVQLLQKAPEYADRQVFASMDFLDEAIWLNDREMMERCTGDPDLWLHIRRKEAKRIQMQKDVLNGHREEYLQELEKRKSRYLRKLQKEAGLKLE